MKGVVGVAVLDWLHVNAAATPVQAGGFWDWTGASLSAGNIISGGGLLTIVVLFYTNRILTIGQHRARVADLVKYYDALLQSKDESYKALETAKDDAATAQATDSNLRYDEMKEARDYWRLTSDVQREAREKAESGLREFADEYAKLSNHLLGSIEQAAEKP
jgi:hypothetical protein